MNKIKYNILYLIGLLVLMASIITVFAGFVFSQSVVISTKLGGISPDIDKKYLIYERGVSTDISDDNYVDPTDTTKVNKAMKLRKDTVAIIDEIELNFTATYTVAAHDNHELFVEGTKYYTKSGSVYTLAEVEYGTEIPATPDYYIEAGRTYSGIKTAKGYDPSITTINWTITNNTKLSATVSGVAIEITFEIDQSGKLKNPVVKATNKNYRAVIGSDGLYVVILDADKTNDSNYYREESANTGSITLSATANKYLANPSDSKYFMSQVGVKFSFQSAINVYVRVRIRDAWTKIDVYGSLPKSRYSIKPDLGTSPFAVTDGSWYYDQENNYLYLKNMYQPDYVVASGTFVNGTAYYTRTGNGTTIPYEYSMATVTAGATIPADTYYVLERKSYSFNINEAYYYTAASSIAYTEYVDVGFSYTVEIVQANRIYAKWGIDPSVDFS